MSRRRRRFHLAPTIRRRPAWAVAPLATTAAIAVVSLGATAAAAAEVCPKTALAPDCRGYEMVSAPDKNAADVIYTLSRMTASSSGDAFAYQTPISFGDAQGTGVTLQNIARRTSDGWITKGVTPLQDSNVFTALNGATFWDFSDDLSIGLLNAYRPAPVAGAEGDNNLYLRDNTTDSYELVTTAAPAVPSLAYQPYYGGASEDFERVVFESNGALTPDAVDDGTWQVYESVDGELELLSVMEDGVPAAGGAGVGPGAQSFGFQSSRRFTKSAVSEDGSRVFFTVAPDFAGRGQIYGRLGGTTTVHVTASQRSTPDPAGPRPALFQRASADGRYVVFLTAEQLLDDDVDSTDDVYRYDVETGDLVRLSINATDPDLSNADSVGVMHISRDGERVYFTATRLLPSDPPIATGTYGVYLWDRGEIRFVGLLSGQDTGNNDVTGVDYQSGWSVGGTPDGSRLLFTSQSPQLGYESNGMRQIFVYDAVSGVLKCASCKPGASQATGAAQIFQRWDGVPGTTLPFDVQALTADGRYAFFATSEPIDDVNDVNGRKDVYQFEFDSGRATLISSGRSQYDSLFAGAGADGRDAFFLTRERLSGWDTDDNLDVYDARIGGGDLPEPPRVIAPCAEDACQPPPAERSAPPTPSSLTLTGPGNARKGGARAASVRIGRKSSSDGAIRLRIRASSKGRLVVRGPRVRKVSRALARGGAHSVRTVLKPAAKRTLETRGRLRVRVVVTFTPSGGTPMTKSTTLTARG